MDTDIELGVLNKGKQPNDTSSEVHSHSGVSTAQQSIPSTSGRSLAYDVQSIKEREAHTILNAYLESPDILSGPMHGSRFHFRAEDILKESKEWEARLQYWFSDAAIKEQAGSRTDFTRRSTNCRTIKTYLDIQMHNLAYYERRVKLLQAEPNVSLGVDIAVGAPYLQTFLEKLGPRSQTLIGQLAPLLETDWYEAKPSDHAIDEYFWLIDASMMVSDAIERLEGIAAQPISWDGPTEEPAPPDATLEATRLTVPIVGPSETANSRALQWMEMNSGRPSPLDQVRNARGMNDARTESTANSYKSNIAAQGVVAVFGASVSLSAVFSGTRGSLLLLSWSAACFVTASIATAGIGIILASGIELDRRKTLRRILRAYTVLSALLILSGVSLASVAMSELNNTIDITEGSSRAQKASGYFTISLSFMFIVSACVVRFKYADWRS